MTGRKDDIMQIASQQLSGNHVDLTDTVYLVTEELHPYSNIRRVGRHYLNSISPDSELGSCKVNIVALVLYPHQLSNKLFTGNLLPFAYRYHHRFILCGIAH